MHHGPRSVLNAEDVAGNNTGQASVCVPRQVVVKAMKRNEAEERVEVQGGGGRRGFFLYTQSLDTASKLR